MGKALDQEGVALGTAGILVLAAVAPVDMRNLQLLRRGKGFLQERLAGRGKIELVGGMVSAKVPHPDAEIREDRPELFHIGKGVLAFDQKGGHLHRGGGLCQGLQARDDRFCRAVAVTPIKTLVAFQIDRVRIDEGKNPSQRGLAERSVGDKNRRDRLIFRHPGAIQQVVLPHDRFAVGEGDGDVPFDRLLDEHLRGDVPVRPLLMEFLLADRVVLAKRAGKVAPEEGCAEGV